MKYPVDATVLSAATKPAPDPRVLAWLRDHEAEVAVDPVIPGELRFGILIQPVSKKRRGLERWFAAGAERFVCRNWDLATGLRWAQLLASLRQSGNAMPVKDSLIAATALTHGLTMVTRNREDFAKTGLEIVDPFWG